VTVLATQPVHLLVPGPLNQMTGGFLYLRRLVEGWRERGGRMIVHELPGQFPWPDAATLTCGDHVVASIPDEALVLVDGLALPAVAGSLYLDRFRLRTAALVHHPLHLETGLDAASAVVMRQLESAALGQVRRVICNSQATAADVQALGIPAERLAVVMPGTDAPPQTLRARSMPAADRRVAGGSAVLNLLCVATLTPRKGHDTLIAALASLTDLPWRLQLVGSTDRDPAWVSGLRTAIAERGLTGRIDIAGEVDATVLEDAWRQADLFVLPSWHEGFGMAVAEALVRGLPVVTGDRGALRELAPPEAGALVPPGDADSLAVALRRLLSDPDLRIRASVAALAAGRRLPDWTQSIDRFRAELSCILPRDRRIERIA
jgi:glycosyltransferase involved in cell wall biosynthesis